MFVLVHSGLGRSQNLGELPLTETGLLADLLDPLAHADLVERFHVSFVALEPAFGLMVNMGRDI
jgi:hypothetical protein